MNGEMPEIWPWSNFKILFLYFPWGDVTENYEVSVRTAALRVDNRNQNIPPFTKQDGRPLYHKAGFHQEVQILLLPEARANMTPCTVLHIYLPN
jgi:hypothetical protein